MAGKLEVVVVGTCRALGAKVYNLVELACILEVLVVESTCMASVVKDYILVLVETCTALVLVACILEVMVVET